jgi:hypothetical protein
LYVTRGNRTLRACTKPFHIDEEFFMILSGILHIRLLQWQRTPEDIKFFLGDFMQLGFNSDLERVSTKRARRKARQSVKGGETEVH